MKKSILITYQKVSGGNIPPYKPVGFVSLNFDNKKLTIDAYDGIGSSAKPREKCLIIVADEKTVFEISSEALLDIIRFYIDYSDSSELVVHYRNKHHYIVPED